MAEHEDQQIRDALQQSFPPINTELQRDLWPQVLRRLDTRPVHVPWYDWALAAFSAALFFVFPRLLLVFAYHL